MKLTTKTSDVLIPAWNGNKDLPEKDQVKVHITFPTNKERENISQIEYKTGGESYLFKYDSDRVIGKCVTKIENLVDEVDGKEKSIKDGEQLLASRNKVLSGLIQEIAVAVLKADDIDEVVEKN